MPNLLIAHNELVDLLTPEGQAALQAASHVGDDPLAAAAAMRSHGFSRELAAAALTQVELRKRAVKKFGADAATMFFTRAGLEQATRAVVANRRAARLRTAGIRKIVDLGCGIGADSKAFIDGYAVEADPLTAQFAALNAPDATIICGDARDFDLSLVDAVFCDPARRSGGRRVFRPEDYSPPWDWVMTLPERVAHTVLKLAPGIDQDLLPAGSELELVSVDGEVVEAAAWCGPLAQVPRRATVFHGDKVSELTGTGNELAPVGEIGAYLSDPDGAVVRSHLVAELASGVDGRLADPTIAYIWSEKPLTGPFGRSFAVDEVLPFSLKRLRAALRARGVGRLEILKRGSALDVSELRQSLRLEGSAPASLILTRVAGRPVAVIAQPVVTA